MIIVYWLEFHEDYWDSTETYVGNIYISLIKENKKETMKNRLLYTEYFVKVFSSYIDSS